MALTGEGGLTAVLADRAVLAVGAVLAVAVAGLVGCAVGWADGPAVGLVPEVADEIELSGLVGSGAARAGLALAGLAPTVIAGR